jgi:hypothetical protein
MSPSHDDLLGDLLLAMILTYITGAWFGIGCLIKSMLIG